MPEAAFRIMNPPCCIDGCVCPNHPAFHIQTAPCRVGGCALTKLLELAPHIAVRAVRATDPSHQASLGLANSGVVDPSWRRRPRTRATATGCSWASRRCWRRAWSSSTTAWTTSSPSSRRRAHACPRPAQQLSLCISVSRAVSGHTRRMHTASNGMHMAVNLRASEQHTCLHP